MEQKLYMAVLAGILVLLLLIIRFKIPAFIALLLASISTGLIAGMDPANVIVSIKDGMGKTLGFIATVVGLGAIFGGILEHTGGAKTLAKWMLGLLGEKMAPIALMFTGFLVSIPVFFDVGFVILFPAIIALQKQTGKSLIHFALPLLGGLAVSHAFIPPTPGPMAVAEILNVPFAHLIIFGVIVGLPSALLGGVVYGKYLGKRLHIESPKVSLDASSLPNLRPPGIKKVLPILLLPIVLIILSTFIDTDMIHIPNEGLKKTLSMICHPFSALIIANLMAWVILGLNSGLNKEQLTKISTNSLSPVGIIILVTGAGGVFKEILVSTGAGEIIAKSMQDAGFSIVVFAFLAAAFIRVMQGSATVAMITAAGLVAPLLQHFPLSDIQLALIAISISSGATVLSHLNDSGFWMIKEFMGLSETQAMRTWTIGSSIIGITGFLFCLGLYYLL